MKRDAIALILALTGLLVGCSRDRNAPSGEIVGLSDLRGRVCADLLGTAFQEIVPAYQEGVRFQTFNDYSSAMEAVRVGKVDAMPLDTAIARLWVSKRPEDFRLALSFGRNPYAYLFPKGSALRAGADEVLGRLEKSGEIKRLVSKWCDADDLDAVELDPLPPPADGAGVLRFATSGDFEPGVFVRKGEFVGFDIDIARRIASAMGRRLEVVQVNMSSLVPTVQFGKADMGGGCITVTEERAQKVDFSRVYMDEGFSIVVRNASGEAADGGFGVRTCLRSLRDSFVRTFVTESRWQLMARGLGVTLLITLLAAFFGTILAFPVWLARTSKIELVASCARACIAVLQGTPVLVLLMVLFYIVFGRVDIEGVWVAVIGFSLNASVYIGEMLRSGVDSIPRGQTEAALALGYRPTRAFCRFVLPQAVQVILPVYRGELIALLKSTSVVGYIAINDITKASDLIRSRTYESFFPILTTAFIYFAVAWLLAKLLERIGK